MSVATVHPVFGLLAPHLAWAPSPSYLLRRDRILRHLRNEPPGRVLEVGCGAGALATELASRGHRVTALESSAPARGRARSLAEAAGVEVDIREEPEAGWSGFDVLMAFEVLEHIEDDVTAFTEWVSWLRPGGLMLLSVPAHQSQWNAGDEWAGHFRRYERRDLAALYDRAGLEILDMETWGFPVANLMQPLSAMVYRRRIERRSATSKAEATAASGIERGLQVKMQNVYVNPIGSLGFRMLYGLQGLAAHTDWGVGFLVAARKRA